MSHALDRRQTARDETDDQKADRRYDELLQELRVAQTGVQFLFAFLLTLAFTQRFARITDFQHGLYVATLMATTVASALLIGPVPMHRILFRRGLKPRLVRGADLMARGGLAMLLARDQRCSAADPGRRAGGVLPFVLSGLATAWFVLVWYVVPADRARTR